MTAREILQAMIASCGGRTLVFGHRGAAHDAPPNTVPAFELAAQQGADGTELDVHRSKDGYPVVMHDFTVDATTNGTGRVDAMTLAELKALDAGATFGAEFMGTQIPTLDEVFEAVGRRLYINVELKSITPESDGLEQAVADCIRRHSMEARVIVSSFNPLALARFRAALAEVPIAFLYGKDSPPIVLSLIEGMDYEVYHPQHDLIDAALVTKAHQNGRLVNAWTVNDMKRGATLREMGVDGIITDVPGQMRVALSI